MTTPQIELFPDTDPTPAVDRWIGHPGPTGRNGKWTLANMPGVAVWHCGHPTALRPYYIEGVRVDRCFRLLSEAQAAAVAAYTGEHPWRCHARPAAYGGRMCGYQNSGQMATTFHGRLVEFCAGCGCTKIASEARRIADMCREADAGRQP